MAYNCFVHSESFKHHLIYNPRVFRSEEHQGWVKTDNVEKGHGFIPMKFAGLKAIIFEDDFLLAEALTDVLTSTGCDVVACEGSFQRSLDVAESTICDFAVVDLHLQGIAAFPVLDTLLSRDIPFIIATSAHSRDIPEKYLSAPCIIKPYDKTQLDQAIEKICVVGDLPKNWRD